MGACPATENPWTLVKTVNLHDEDEDHVPHKDEPELPQKTSQTSGQENNVAPVSQDLKSTQ